MENSWGTFPGVLVKRHNELFVSLFQTSLIKSPICPTNIVRLDNKTKFNIIFCDTEIGEFHLKCCIN